MAILHIVLLLLPFVQALTDIGLTCRQHPSASKVSHPPLVYSHTFYLRDTTLSERVFQNVRFSDFVYTPVDGSSEKYRNLDIFYAGAARRAGGKNLVQLHFQRRGMVYMMLNAAGYFDGKEGKLAGWKSEGWAQRVHGGDVYEYGLHQTNKMALAPYVYVFSRRTDGKMTVDLPQFEWVEKNVKGVESAGVYHVRMAEWDGSASKEPEKFRGSVVRPNERCPKKLHDSWGVRDGREGWFASWHPQWDPCYWCAYDHEHGSATPYVMKYWPKYGYVASKHGVGESNEGFKDFVVDYKGFFVYVGVHVQTSSLRRVSVANHTVTFVVKKKGSLRLMAELTVKANFGFLGVRGKRDKFLPVRERDVDIRDGMGEGAESVRSINVINDRKLDKRFRYNDNQVGMGVYEEWSAQMPCSTVSPGGKQLTFDIQDPITGIRDGKSTKKIELGMTGVHNGFLHNVGIKRVVRAEGLQFAAKHCGTEGFEGGYFYTDVYGRMREGPGKDAVRQFVRRGFEIAITGRFVPQGNWLGVHKDGGSATFLQDHGYGIDYRVN